VPQHLPSEEDLIVRGRAVSAALVASLRQAAAFAAFFVLPVIVLSAVVAPAAAQDAERVKRGEYIFTAAGCHGCHTDEKRGGKPLAGGRPLETPFGTYVSPNITPDKATGIGAWSDEEFRKALRKGVAADGANLFPVFPYTSYTGMSDADIDSLRAYLATREPVRRENEPHQVRWPFNWRFTITFWKMLFFREGPLEPDPAKSEEWNRGRYLVDAVGHCGECHTPRNVFGAMQRDRHFAGVRGGPDGQNAPNITPDKETGIGGWSEQDIVTLLKDGQTPDFDYVGSGMGEVVKNTGKLAEADLKAIAVYLKSLPPLPGPPKKKK
jgi:mono/diheme cytochrome c family protein